MDVRHRRGGVSQTGHGAPHLCRLASVAVRPRPLAGQRRHRPAAPAFRPTPICPAPNVERLRIWRCSHLAPSRSQPLDAGVTGGLGGTARVPSNVRSVALVTRKTPPTGGPAHRRPPDEQTVIPAIGAEPVRVAQSDSSAGGFDMLGVTCIKKSALAPRPALSTGCRRTHSGRSSGTSRTDWPS
jgi:hypothetical protein